MGTGRGRVEDEDDVLEHIHAAQAFNTFVGHGHAHALGAGQTVGGRVDADHDRHFQVFGVTQDLDHQVGADVAGTDDGDFEFVHCCCLICTQVADHSALN
ncbi:hypothetical protein D3C76_984690 [compost metagenome]